MYAGHCGDPGALSASGEAAGGGAMKGDCLLSVAATPNRKQSQDIKTEALPGNDRASV
ncbi:hypothetical protein [Bacteroides pyogenes]|uniref:hypothetical protein n=1 Tax=Bacteroides pyogenes TaxID=310300 RepID=UPI00242F47DC|nr:hypothetical protein [Bacteroides pyogenes]MDY5432610.1 hypothetical protein [Bacteroides pyogenes]